MTDLVDMRTLSRAMGFMLVMLRDGSMNTREGAARAEKLSALITEFCKITEDEIATERAQLAEDEAPAQGLWSCEHLADHSIIHTARDNNPKHDLEIRGANESSTRRAAEHIVHAVNDNSRKEILIAEMSACLEMCMESDALTWDAEHEAGVLINRAQRTRRK